MDWVVGHASLRARGLNAADIHREAFSSGGTIDVAPGASFAITFARSGLQARWTAANGTLSTIAETAGVHVPSGCRMGECGSRAARIIEGSVAAVSDARPDQADECLTCQSYPLSDLVIDL